MSDVATYVVHHIGDDGDEHSAPLHFRTMGEALAHADHQVEQPSSVARADVRRVDGISNPAAAIAASRSGTSVFVQSRSRRTPQAEIDRGMKAAVSKGARAGLEFLGLVRRQPDPPKIERRD